MRAFTRGAHYLDVTQYRRRLPHWQPDGKALFITWRLYGSLPANFTAPDGLISGQAFAWIDRYLDQARYGPAWMRRDDIAKL